MQVRCFAAAACAFLNVTPALASTIDVLWVAGSEPYNANVMDFATAAPSYDPDGNGSLEWSLTLWDYAANPSPDFSNYDVLVVGSTYAVDETYGRGAGGTTGFFGNGVVASGVLANEKAIAEARGLRTFLTGQDPDWHDYNNYSGRLDGPVGFLINAVNWAASGERLGIVSFSDRYHLGPYADMGWWTAPGSFLAAELGGHVVALQSDSVYLGDNQEDFPLNEGLTSSGLSRWSTSAHAAFAEIEGYERINFNQPGSSGLGITIVTRGQEAGGTSGPSPAPIPLPGTAMFLMAAAGGIGLLRRRTQSEAR